MLLFCPPRSRHCSRYFGESCSPLPSTPRAHLAASTLSLPLVISLGLCHGGRAFGTDQRAFVFEEARVWRTSPHHDACRVLPERRVGVRLSLLRGGPNRGARLGLNTLFVCFYRWRAHQERESRAVRMDVWYVFAPLFTQPLVALYPDGKGIAGAPLMSHDGQFGQDQQAVVGDFYVPHEMGPQDPDPAAPGTHRVTGHDLLRVDQRDAPVTDRHQNPSSLRFFENLTRGSRRCPR